MKIGELARLAQCSVETVRYYEKAGLLPPAARSDSNYRYYGDAHVARLRFIRNCRALDMTHEEVRALLGLVDQPENSCSGVNRVLDEHGTEYRSVEFAAWLQKRMNSGMKRLVLVIGGPYGFSEAVYARADARLSLSKMTFSHQIVRALFAEQLYRAFTILNNEPYHHE